MSSPRSDRPPKAVGITGGIGCGKSEVARILQSDGVPVLDADDVAREVVEAGSEALGEIKERFGAGVIRPDGGLDRGALARIVFAHAPSLQALNAIVHPRVRARMQAWVAVQRGAGQSCAGIIPLLYETGGEGNWDAVLCVAASDETVWPRLRARGWSDEEILRRRAAQWPLSEKRKRADVVIENDGTREALVAHVRAAWQKIL